MAMAMVGRAAPTPNGGAGRGLGLRGATKKVGGNYLGFDLATGSPVGWVAWGRRGFLAPTPTLEGSRDIFHLLIVQRRRLGLKRAKAIESWTA